MTCICAYGLVDLTFVSFFNICGVKNTLTLFLALTVELVCFQSYKVWILKTITETWNLFHKKFLALWDEHKDGPGEAYLPEIYNNTELQQLVKQKYTKELFEDTLGFGAAKMIR